MAFVLQQRNVRVSIVEHLMSALAGLGLGIDNVHVDLIGEVPIMDGSGATFVYLLRSSGIVMPPWLMAPCANCRKVLNASGAVWPKGAVCLGGRGDFAPGLLA